MWIAVVSKVFCKSKDTRKDAIYDQLSAWQLSDYNAGDLDIIKHTIRLTEPLKSSQGTGCS